MLKMFFFCLFWTKTMNSKLGRRIDSKQSNGWEVRRVRSILRHSTCFALHYDSSTRRRFLLFQRRNRHYETRDWHIQNITIGWWLCIRLFETWWNYRFDGKSTLARLVFTSFHLIDIFFISFEKEEDKNKRRKNNRIWSDQFLIFPFFFFYFFRLFIRFIFHFYLLFSFECQFRSKNLRLKVVCLFVWKQIF